MKSLSSSRGSPNQSGVVLLELLIAILVFSFGVLGIVGLAAVSTKGVSESRYRTEAAALADEYIAQISIANSSTWANFATGGTVFNAWKAERITRPGTGLPNGDASVAVGTAAYAGGVARGNVTIEISWKDPSRGTAEEKSRHVTVGVVYPPQL